MSKNLFGLIGFPLGHSFSKGYFTNKFQNMGLSVSHEYELFEIENIEEITSLLAKYKENLTGLNVTIPHKEAIIPFLDEIDSAAQVIGAVNCIKIEKNGTTKGYNTDYWGFRWTLEKWTALQEIKPQKALILGKGGAAKAIEKALIDLGIQPLYVSRKKEMATIDYPEIDEKIMAEHLLIVNTTPLGMYPKTELCPDIPYHLLSSKHLLYDIVYNPLETNFMQKGLAMGVKSVHDGLQMLHGQAEKAWEIWNE
jgi:shikimate dehydrogenase